jgi:hypothetical protein
MSDFETVLVSALTSAGVALAIEWAAKPRLEARKERILERSQARREIIRQLGTIVSLAASLEADTSSLTAAERRIMHEALEERRADVVAASKAAERALAIVVLRMDKRTRVVMSRAIGMIQGIALSEKLRGQAGQELATVSSIALDVYYWPRWHVRKRRKLLAVADQLFGVTAPAESS